MEKEANDGIKQLKSLPSDPLLPCSFIWDKCDLADSELIAPLNNDSAMWFPTFLLWGDPEGNVTLQREWAESTTVSSINVCCSQ